MVKKNVEEKKHAQFVGVALSRKLSYLHIQSDIQKSFLDILSNIFASFHICKIVPAKSHAIATAKLIPMQDSRRPVQVNGYALGYMSLTQKVSTFSSSFSCQFIVSLTCSNIHLI